MTSLNVQAKGYEALQERSSHLTGRVQAAQQLSPVEKSKFMARLQQVWAAAEERREKADNEVDKALAKIIDEAVQSISGQKNITRAGTHVLRAAGLNLTTLVERYNAVTNGAADGAQARDRVRTMATKAFALSNRLTFSVGSSKQEQVYNGLLALGAVLRARSYAYATSQLWEVMPTMDTMSVQDLQLRIDDALRAYSANDAVHAMKELSVHSQQLPVEKKIRKVEPVAVLGSETNVVIIPEHFEKAIVKPGEDAVQTLRRIIEDNPKRYGYHGADDELSIDLFARRLAQDAAQKDGLLRMWFTDAAAGKLAVIPVEKSDGYHLMFLDAKTQEEISSKTLKTYTKTKPRA